MLDEKILNILRQKGGAYVSGEDLSRHADISRTAIWKRVEKLREEGYEIEASPHLGYRLTGIPDRLIPSEIKVGLRTKIIAKEIISYKKVGSTNDIAYSLAEKGLKDGTVIIAEEQEHGKGRLGRRWISPPESGIYLSIIMRPRISPNEIPRITLLAAVAVAGAIREATGLWALIKWPNDILVNGKKVCGILTEMKAEQDRVAFVIVGIGINVNAPDGHLPKGATSLEEEMERPAKDTKISRVDLARQILEEIEKNYFIMRDKGFDPIIESWKGLTAMIGSRVKVMQEEKVIEGQVYDIDTDGSLLVRRESGMIERVSSGDVTLVR